MVVLLCKKRVVVWGQWEQRTRHQFGTIDVVAVAAIVCCHLSPFIAMQLLLLPLLLLLLRWRLLHFDVIIDV